MYVIRVIPVAKSILKEELSYFSKKKYDLGSLVEIPVRNKKMYGIVHKVEPARNLKAELRGSSFELKQLKESAKVNKLLSPTFAKVAEKLALYHAHPLSMMLDAIVPRKILHNFEKIPEAVQKPHKESVVPEKLIFQDETKKRLEHYRALIRESFARGKSIFILVAHTQDGARLEKELRKGIEEYLINFTKTFSEQDLLDLFSKARTEKHPLLIIGTGKFISIERHDIGTLIVERESSRAYRGIGRPYIDYRIWAEYYASQIGSEIIFADTMLRVETMGRYEKGELNEHMPLKRKMNLPPQVELVDMREKMNKRNYDPATLSLSMKKAIEKSQEAGTKMVIISARKGLSPVTYCKDCGTIIACPNCNANMILHSHAQGNFYLCHKCGEKSTAALTCNHCNSWNLIAYGTGIERVEKELLELLPRKHIIRLDKDTAPTLTKAREQIEEWKQNGVVLLGTERMLSFIHEARVSVPYAGIAGIDALFSIPDFRIYERIFSLIVSLGSCVKENLIIDTRNPEHPLFSAISRNDLMNFYREELDLRKQLSYPPESVFIKISLSGKKEVVMKDMESLKETLPEKDTVLFPALVRRKGLYTMHALLKIDYSSWPDENLSKILASLPPRFIVQVDPESLLS